MATIHYVEELTLEWTAGGVNFAKTFAELGVTKATLKEAVRGGDELSLTVLRKVDDAVLWTRNQRVRLRNKAGQIVYHGWCREPRTPLSATSERHDYTFGPPTRFLESTFKDFTWFGTGTEKTQILTPNVILNYQVTEVEEGGDISLVGSQITSRQQVTQILTVAQQTGDRGGPAPFAFDLAGLGDFGVPMNKRSSISFAEALNLELMWDPAEDWHWDHRRADPMLRIARYDMSTSPPTVTGTPYGAVNTLPNDGSMISSLEPVPLDGKLCSTVELVYTWTEENDVSAVDGGTTKTFTPRSTVEIATADNGSPVTLSIQVDLVKETWDGTTYGTPEPVPSEGLADRILNACRAVLWQFNFRTETTGLHWEWRLGQLWNVSGAQPAHAAAYAIAVSIERDLVRGVVNMQTGAPSFLSSSDLLSLTALTRVKRAAPTAGDVSKQASYAEPDAATPPEPAVEEVTPSTAASVVKSTASGVTTWTFKLPGAKPVSVDSVTALAAGATPTVEDVGDSDNVKLKFGIPPGADGADSTVEGPAGASPVLSAVEVTMTSPSAPASGSFTGPTTGLTLHLTIPSGAAGRDGTDGTNGGTFSDAPSDGAIYARHLGTWVAIG